MLCPYYSYEEIASSSAKGIRSRNDMRKGDQQVAPTDGVGAGAPTYPSGTWIPP